MLLFLPPSPVSKHWRPKNDSAHCDKNAEAHKSHLFTQMLHFCSCTSSTVMQRFSIKRQNGVDLGKKAHRRKCTSAIKLVYKKHILGASASPWNDSHRLKLCQLTSALHTSTPRTLPPTLASQKINFCDSQLIFTLTYDSLNLASNAVQLSCLLEHGSGEMTFVFCTTAVY